MPFPFIAAAALGGAGLNFLGGILGNRSQNQQRQQMLAQQQQMLQYLQSQGIQNPEAYLQQAWDPLRLFGTDMLGGAAGNMQGFMGGTQQQLLDYLQQTAPQFMMPGDMSAYYNSPMADIGRSYADPTNFLSGRMYGVQDQYQPTLDMFSRMGLGQDQGMAALLERGNNLVDQFGNTGSNMNAQDAAGRAFSAGGYSPQFTDLQNRGNALFDTGGYNPAIQSMSGTATNALAGLGPGGAGRQTQGGILGGAGQQAIAGLLSPMAMPMLQSGISPQQLSGAFMQGMDSGYTPQNMGVGAMGFQGMQDLLNRNGQIDDVIAAANQAFTGQLPGGAGGDPFLSQINSAIGRLGGISVGGGGGASGASAGSMGPMQEDLAAMLARGRELFSRESLIPMSQRISMARDEAANAIQGQAEAARRFALSRGGGGPVLASGTANQLMMDWGDQMARAQAEAQRNAILDQQGLQLQQQMQGGQVGIGAANADTNRQQVAASRDIASANNATQASVANAQMANSAAIQNAQLQMAAQQAALQAAIAARGQNYGQSQAGLSALLGAQQLANQRGGIFNDAMLGALSDATNRYGIGMQALPGLANADVNRMQVQGNFINQWNQNDTARNLGAGQLALQGSQIAGDQSNQLAQIMAQLGLGSEGLANQRIGMGLDAAGQAGGLANQALGLYGQIGNAASQDQLARMGLGADMLNSNINARLGAGQQGINGMNSMYGNQINLGQLWNQNNQTQAQLWQNMYGNDFANRQLGASAYNDYFRNTLGLGGVMNDMYDTAINPMASMAGGMVNYGSNALSAYGNMGGNQSRNIPQQQSPWPQLNIQPGMLGGFGGGGGNNGYGGIDSIGGDGVSSPLGAIGGLNSIPGFGGGFNANAQSPLSVYGIGGMNMPGYGGGGMMPAPNVGQPSNYGNPLAAYGIGTVMNLPGYTGGFNANAGGTLGQYGIGNYSMPGWRP